MQRKRFIISGEVQGVGFRPFLFRLALEHGLSGYVHNTTAGVELEIQGQSEQLLNFWRAFYTEIPPLARVAAVTEQELELITSEKNFTIAASSIGQQKQALSSPDTATCKDCYNEIFNPADRRFAYPFTNCTNCGPRYTITRSLPYDRSQTSMDCFPMCPLCDAEYRSPQNRRFHAQPNACPNCGPQIRYLEDLSNISLTSQPDFFDTGTCGKAALQSLAHALAAEQIVAIKGLGGFHLSCDATSDNAVQLLRKRKMRPHKPLAIMVANLEEAQKIVRLTALEKGLLTGPEAPIVLCPKLNHNGLSTLIAPDTDFVGIMLPYTPLHHLLLQAFTEITGSTGKILPNALVMTSGNSGGEPICLSNREALKRLAKLADCALLHNRDILIRTDDSVLRAVPPAENGSIPFSNTIMLRRARGYTPRRLPLPQKSIIDSAPTILALGAELKNTICLTRGEEAFVSQHIGDVQNLETLQFQQEITEHLQGLLQVKPKLIVHDAHPDFTGRITANNSDLPTLTLQHHFAHAEAVLAENQHTAPALVLVLDGSGYSPDGTIWGGELLYLDSKHNLHQRVGHLAHLPLPGGEAAIREPWRIAHAFLYQNKLIATPDSIQSLPWLPEQEQVVALIPQLLATHLNTPMTSSCGRLFDTAAALLGICNVISYEAQAAIRLETAQGKPEENFYNTLGNFFGQDDLNICLLRNYPDNMLVLDSSKLLSRIFMLSVEGIDKKYLARLFHWVLSEGLAHMAGAAATIHGVRHIGLSGGVLQNLSLYTLLCQKLSDRGLIPLVHHELPPGDACIAYGQAAWAYRQTI